MRILLVEDDALLGDGIAKGLKVRRFIVDWVQDGASADTALLLEKFTAVVLDLSLPKLDGLEVLKRLRSRQDQTPVLLLTARDGVSDRIKGLDSGADDYLVKPFDIDELSARLRALARRALGHAEAILRHDGVELDPAAHTVTRHGQPVDLSPKEFAVFRALLENVGRVISKEKLEGHIYGWNEEVESNSIEVHVSHLRKKLGADLIRTVRGVGYTISRPKDEMG
jgi:DNA-binding response OmpR family regulator